MSSERLRRVSATLRADVDARKIPGAVLLVARHGKVVLYDAVGKIDPAGSAPMTKDAIFRIYSMSKPITTVAAMMLVEQGKLKLDDPVAKYIPSFAKMQVGIEKPDSSGGKAALELVPARRPITIQDLMRHTSGLTYGFFGEGLVKKAYVDAQVLRAGRSKPTRNSPTDRQAAARLPAGHHLGLQPFDRRARARDRSRQRQVAVPDREGASARSARHATRPSMSPTRRSSGRIAEPFANDRSIGVGAEFFDPRVAVKWESGGGGMVSTAMDYARFLQMLLNGGTLDGKRYLSPKTLAYMTSDHLGQAIATTPLYLPGPGYGFGLGFAVRKVAGEAAHPAEAGTYYWGGAGGTYFWVDPKTDLLVVLMMQSPKQRVYYRGLLHDMVYAAVMK